jgi:hypothetical protein
MARVIGMRKLGIAVAAAALMVVFLPAGLGSADSPATFTTINPSDGDHCLNGPGVVNCNLYDGKEFVWLNGGPANAQLGGGNYFFAVLSPGGQNDPNDGAADLLSTDAHSNRTFSVSSAGVVTYTGTHVFDSTTGLINVMPYDDTPNNGGVYILAVCTDVTPAKPKDCKYDAFKVLAPEAPVLVQAVIGGVKYIDHLGAGQGQLDPSETTLPGWFISVTDDQGTSFNQLSQTTDSSGQWSFTTPAAAVGSQTRTYTISEVLQSGWRQTGNTTDQSQSIGSVSVALNITTHVYTVTVPSDVGSATGLNFGNIPQGAVSGLKYRDDNKNGKFDTGETGLSPWNITLAGDASATLPTIAGGTFSTVLDPGTYTFTEVQKTPTWKQTGNTDANNQSAVTGGATAVLASFTYTVTIPNDQPSTVTGLNFGNIPQGAVSGLKYYDANTNGKNDSEAGISGWRISEGGAAVATLTTGASGAFNTVLDPGTYTFTEVVAAAPWSQTGNTDANNQSAVTGGATAALAAKSYTVVIPNDQPSTVSGLYFGNVCVGAGGGLTMGYWSNKNGQALITPADLAMLSGLNLRNANGTNFDPTTKDMYRTWLLNATATNMAYMLSAQLSAMELNVAHGFVNGSALIYAPGTTSANGAGFATVNAVMAEANVELAAHPDTTSGSSGDAFRSYQEALKNALDRANNNLNFVQSSAATCPTPTFP